MESKTLERLIRERNRKLTLWLLAPVALSYLVLQLFLFSLELSALKKQISDWRDGNKDRISQSLFLQNETDLMELFSDGYRLAHKESENLKVTLFSKNWKVIMSHTSRLGQISKMEQPLGMVIDYRKGEIKELSPLYLGDRLQGYLLICSSYPWVRLKDHSLILLLFCVGVFSVLRMGVWLWMHTLRKSIVLPLNWITSEITPKLENFDNLKTVPMARMELEQAPTEIINLVGRYNDLLAQIGELREKEKIYVMDNARMEVATQVAHDMRSPMAALSLAIESLPPLPGKQKDIFLSVLKRVGDISEELLKASQIEKKWGRVNLGGEMLELVSLDTVIQSVVEEKKILLQTKGNFIVKAPEASGFRVTAKDSDLKRALSNLIDNAIEALPAGGEIVIKVTSAQNKIYLSVRDNGIGIAKADFARVWESGVSLGKPHGHGLGLAFVKTVVESWGGRVHLDSALGKGTTVSLELLRVD